MSQRETTGDTLGIWGVIMVVGFGAVIVTLVGLILYSVYVVGPTNEKMLDAFKVQVKDMQCPALKQMIYERNYAYNKAGYTYHAEHEYKWRCHVP